MNAAVAILRLAGPFSSATLRILLRCGRPILPVSAFVVYDSPCLRPARRVRRAGPTRLTDFKRRRSSIRCHIPVANNMSAAQAAQTPKPFRQDLRYYLPRWIAALVVITFIEQLAMFPPTGRGLWYIPSLVLAGVLDGTFGGLVFVGLQRLWNPRDSRVVRIRSYVAAGIIVGVGSLWVMTAIYS